MLSIHLLDKMRHFRYLKEIKYICMYVDPVKKGTTIRLQLTTCVLLRHNKIITLIHFGMIITGTGKNEFTVRL